MRKSFPNLSRKEILEWMPELKDAADLIWKEDTLNVDDEEGSSDEEESD
jgi:hypothetical protein